MKNILNHHREYFCLIINRKKKIKIKIFAYIVQSILKWGSKFERSHYRADEVV
jgi:hypothetical protein